METNSEVAQGFFLTANIESLRESPLNPRKSYNEEKIKELAQSIREIGIIEPLVVRNGGEHFEIIAGSRRYRAAKLAGLQSLPAIKRELDDTQALEIMVTENNQREDVNPLEEAEGYNRLYARGYNLDRLAEKIGRSTKYIYDRLKLLQLIPEAKRLLLADRMTAGHAILLARLKPQDQERAIEPEKGGLFQYEQVDMFDFDERGKDRTADGLEKWEKKYHGLKPHSVRELESWIDDHVRFDRAAPIVQDLFPETAAAVSKAVEDKEKVIQITHEHYIQPDAKEGNTERIYTERSWKLADGSRKDAKTCEKSVTGVIVVGPERGKAYKVCVHKECPVHWLPERKKREREQQSSSAAQTRWQREEQRRQEQYRLEQQKREAWKQATPAIIEACAEKIKTAPFGQLAQIIDGGLDHRYLKKARTLLPKPKDTDGLVRLVALTLLVDEAKDYWAAERKFTLRAKILAVDVKAILKLKVQTSANGAAAEAVHAVHTGQAKIASDGTVTRKKRPASKKKTKRALKAAEASA
jgi:ParB/RepB/Spo0J family partition protein